MAQHEFDHDLFADGRDAGLGELYAAPVVGHGHFGVGDEHGRLGALTVFGSADAVEVGIDGAPTAFGVGDAESSAALTAEDRTLQVVRVLVRLFARLHACPADSLYLLEGLGIDERRVAAVVPNALELHIADVVAVHEHLVDVLDADRPRRPLPCGGDTKPAMLQFGAEPFHGVVA
nr:hypothetical protein [Streptomyces pluripotens]